MGNRLKGERRRKSVRGSIISPDIAVLNLVIVKHGETPIEGLTNKDLPRLRGPKRASKIRKLFHLSKDESVIGYSRFLGRTIQKGTNPEKKRKKFVKVQRLVTPL